MKRATTTSASVARTRATQMGAGASRKTTERRGFSLIEVLLAIFILGIGMIMVASVFPVGANWTRQAAEESVGQMVAQNAMTVIRKHYGPGGDMAANNATSPLPGSANTILNPPAAALANCFELQALPQFTRIPPYERAFQFGSSNPFPASNPQGCTYFWTALARLNPSQRDPRIAAPTPLRATSFTYDLYILVFRKGAAENTFTDTLTTPPLAKEIPGLRTLTTMGNRPAEYYIPSLYYVAYNKGTYNATASPPVSGAVPAMGNIGIGMDSGTVFRQVVDFISTGAPSGAAPRPMLRGQTAQNVAPQEAVIFSPPADNAQASPLIYVYQTTITF